MMRKRMVTFLIVICLTAAGAFSETGIPYGQSQLENILASYDGAEFILSDQLQIVRNNVNFRETPGGNVLGILQGGTVLDCLDETQYDGELWYHARSAEYGEGFVTGTFARPVWNNMDWWPLPDTEDMVSDNMVLFAYWMGTYQLEHGLSVIETSGTERQLSIAPMTVRGNESLIPEDMKILLVSRLYEYGFICRNSAYDQLADPSLSFEEKNGIAASVLQKHYGTDDIWQIISRGSLVLFIHPNDLHARPEGPASDKDQTLGHALTEKLAGEHPGRDGSPGSDSGNTEEVQEMRMTIGGTAVQVEWENNESVDALRELAKDGLTIQMSMYGGFEQVGHIGTSLPRNDAQTTTASGDIMLYSGNQIVIFYDSNSWAYTRLGRITDQSARDMRELLGNGDVTISLTAD